MTDLKNLILLSMCTCAAAADLGLVQAASRADWAAVRIQAAQKAGLNATLADGSTALHLAARADEVATVEALLQAGADVNAVNLYGATPLELAVSNGRAATVKRLLKAGANPNARNAGGETVLMAAARIGDPETISELISGGAGVNETKDPSRETALIIATLAGKSKAVRILLAKGAEPNAMTIPGPTITPALYSGGGSHGDGITRRFSMPHTVGQMSSLHYAARDGNLESVDALLSHGANLNIVQADGATPLLMAILNNRLKVARRLVDKGADVNAADGYGRSPLWAATELRDVEIDSPKMPEEGVDREAALAFITFLLDNKANMNARITASTPERAVGAMRNLYWVGRAGETPFLRAAMSGDTTLMRLLLKRGADPKITTEEGTNALMLAAGINWVEGVSYLESDGAPLATARMCVEELGFDLDAQNAEGFTALHGAANRGSDDIIAYLVSKGARLDIKDKTGRMPLSFAEGVFLGAKTEVRRPKTAALIRELLADPKLAAAKMRQAAAAGQEAAQVKASTAETQK